MLVLKCFYSEFNSWLIWSVSSRLWDNMNHLLLWLPALSHRLLCTDSVNELKANNICLISSPVKIISSSVIIFRFHSSDRRFGLLITDWIDSQAIKDHSQCLLLLSIISGTAELILVLREQHLHTQPHWAWILYNELLPWSLHLKTSDGN